MKKQLYCVWSVSIISLVLLLGCSRVDPHKNWPSCEGKVIALRQLTDEKPSVPNTFDYESEVVFEYQGKSHKLLQRISESKASLLSIGQTLPVRVNPQAMEKSEMEIPVPYPDKSGMNWRRMPKNLTTKPVVEVK